ncbi:hypothetical protein [Deinococcus roseus]|uniref:hypothetical protein n=1 Tax=Deinococcus roseus TaxID=392414 RepID=UPI001666D6B4|nr:hypothetical protein [Deinococcus roseus]
MKPHAFQKYLDRLGIANEAGQLVASIRDLPADSKSWIQKPEKPDVSDFQRNLKSGNHSVVLAQASERVSESFHRSRRLRSLPETEQRVFDALHRLCWDHACFHGRKVGQGCYVVHTSAELLMDYLDIGKTRFYEALGRLRQSSLVASKGFVCRLPQRMVKSGTLFAVVMDPSSEHQARFRFWDWNHEYRSMEKDIASGNTVFRFLRAQKTKNEHTKTFSDRKRKYLVLKGFTLSGQLNQDSVVASVCPPAARNFKNFVFSLSEGQLLRAQERKAWVDQAAQQLAGLLEDHHSLNLYRWCLWRLLAASERGLDLWHHFQAALLNIFGDLDDGIRSRWGAILIAKLKRSGIWQDLAAI